MSSLPLSSSSALFAQRLQASPSCPYRTCGRVRQQSKRIGQILLRQQLRARPFRRRPPQGLGGDEGRRAVGVHIVVRKGGTNANPLPGHQGVGLLWMAAERVAHLIIRTVVWGMLEQV